LGVNSIIHKYDKDNTAKWGKLHMSSKQTCICLIHSVYTKCVFAKTKLQLIITTALH